jgi:AraC-like DNA-binding protein
VIVPQPETVQVLFVERAHVQAAREELGLRSNILTGLKLDETSRLARRSLARVHASFSDPCATRLSREQAFLQFLLACAPLGVVDASKPPRVHPGVKRARDLLHGQFDRARSIETLSREAELSRFHLQRAFRDAYGVSPHAYLNLLRLAHARRQLLAGSAPAEVAATCGFFDQSHLTRHFVRAYGLPPATYALRSSKRRALGSEPPTLMNTALAELDYKDLNGQLSDPFPENQVRGPESHQSGSPISRSPHGHVGPVRHIPILPE